ncbi:MAG: L,D-transpeptidase family protein [Candidatus Competibacteraceae bacterium]|nr:L,D-transpeptidase family protein [Candidatus Competibacteraceae bacterium]
MSKSILMPVWLCALLGACTLNAVPVVAQVAGGPTLPSQSTATHSPAKPAAPIIASLHDHPLPAATSQEPEAPAAAVEETEPAATGEAPPPVETVIAAPLLPPCPQSAGGIDNRIAVQICQRVRTEPPLTRLTVQGRVLRTLEPTIQFYVQRDYQAGWLNADGRPSPAVDALLKAIGEADQEGLHSADYYPAELRKRLKILQQDGSATGDSALAEFDLLLTDTYLTYGSHLLAGRFSPRKIDPEWAIKPRTRDLAVVLQEALGSNTVGESLRALKPQGKGYVRLREVLHHYREVAAKGGWPTVAAGPNLALGSQGQRVQDLRIRLQSSSDLSGSASGKNASALFDKPVAEAVRRFQKRHGLVESGVVNTATLTALNVPVSERIRQVELNLERWRWLPDDFGARYILVNIPSFKMNVFEDGKAVIESNVVVGRQERQTPTFTANMAYLVLSPKWNVPQSIAVKDKLPQLKRSPYALARQNIRVFNRAGQEINPGTVNWQAVSANSFNYQLRQDAGPRNALGGIKFMFPNPYNVYLHDTPSRELFSRNQRTFSSGCIRISNPVELAEYLLKFDPKWTRDTIKTASTSGKQRVVNLQQAMPVYLLYWTAWVDENGLAHFRDDIYQRDKPMLRALYEGNGGNGV